MKKILMVCLGNICRSPLAEGILKSKVNQKEVFVDSAGTSNYHIGDLPDKRSIEVALKYKIDITDQRARQFKVEDFDNFDIIYVMDESNYENVLKLSRNNNDAEKVRLILSELENFEDKNVPDPYFGGKQGFENVYKMLDGACNKIVNKLKNER